MYSECYCPIYTKKKKKHASYTENNQNAKDKIWAIKRIIIIHQTGIVEWHFKCDYLNKISEFDGVSLIDFNFGR